MTAKPWTSGPKELLDHARSHLGSRTAFDCRIAMISIDNAVELANPKVMRKLTEEFS